MGHLPDDMFYEIARHIEDPADIVALGRTNKSIHDIVTENFRDRLEKERIRHKIGKIAYYYAPDDISLSRGKWFSLPVNHDFALMNPELPRSGDRIHFDSFFYEMWILTYAFEHKLTNLELGYSQSWDSYNELTDENIFSSTHDLVPVIGSFYLYIRIDDVLSNLTNIKPGTWKYIGSIARPPHSWRDLESAYHLPVEKAKQANYCSLYLYGQFIYQTRDIDFTFSVFGLAPFDWTGFIEEIRMI